MPALMVSCNKCGCALPAGFANQTELAPCPACGVLLQVAVFPAWLRPAQTGRDGEAILTEGETACFYHSQKRAVVPCDACGRFLCALCDCELQEQHLCPACLESGPKKGRIKNLENHRTLHDGFALTLAIVPMVLCFYITLITAPITLYLAIRNWNAPTSILPRTKIRFVIAILLAAAQLVGWACFIYLLATKLQTGNP
jgi:hypothetical protein